MAFSKVPDSSFTWIINNFEDTLNSLRVKTFYSPKFTTSRDPNREWYLELFLTEELNEHCDRCKTYEKDLKTRVESTIIISKISPSRKKIQGARNLNNSSICNSKVSRKVVGLKFICDESVQEPLELKVEFSVVNSAGRMFSRSLIVSDDEKKYGFGDFIEFEDLRKFFNDGKLEILVEIMFPESGEKKRSFEDFLNEEFLSDVQIPIGGNRISAHKIILASKSPFFHETFLQKKEVNLDDVNPEAFSEILKYIYTGKIENWTLACEILSGANKLQMDDLKFACEQRLRNNLTVNSVIPILMLAEDSKAQCLKEHCFSFILKHVNQIGETENFQFLKSEPGLILKIVRNVFEKSENEEIRINDRIRPISFKNATKRCSDFLKDYESFLNNETLSDIEIHVGGKKYQSHKLILAARSPVFRGMLMSNMKEALSNLVEIKDVNPEVFYELLRYMYTGKVENLQELGLEILKAADKYDLDHLKKICEEFLNENLTHESVLNIIKIADTHNASFLKESCIHYIVKQMIYYSKKKKMKSVLSLEDLVRTHSHILYEILKVLCTMCDVVYG